MKQQLWTNILLLALAAAVLFGLLVFLCRRRGKRVSRGRLLGLSVALLALYVVAGVFIAYLRHPQVSQAYRDAWNVGAFYGDSPDGQQVALVRTNQAALEERLRLFALARERIILSTFDFSADNSGLDVIAALYEAAERGVQVQIVADGFNAMLKMDGEPCFQTLAAHPNVELLIYNPINMLKPWELMGRLHDKYIIIDDSYLLLGGRNTNDFFLGEYPSSIYSRDMEILVCGSGTPEQVARYFREVCALDCTRPYPGAHRRQEAVQELTGRAAQLRETYPQCYEAYDYAAHTYPASRITFLSNPIQTGAKEPRLFWALTQLMASAREQVLLHTPYVICNRAMYDGLAQVAAQVPDARLVLNSAETAANMFGAAVYRNEKDRILETGFALYEYYSPEPGASSHMKAAVIDQRLCVVGSFNLDMRSAYLDTETVLVVDSPELARELAEHMDRIEAASGRVVSETETRFPADAAVPVLPAGKRALLLLLRLIERPFRFLM